MGTFKTEAQKGVVEYKPTTVINTVSTDYDPNWQKTFRTSLLEKVKAYRPFDARKYMSETTVFNGDLENPRYLWNWDAVQSLDIWRLNDLHSLLSNAEKLGVIQKQTS